MLDQLKEGTRTLHEEIEKDNLAGKIVDHTIQEDEYKLLLQQNYAAYVTIEEVINSHSGCLSSDLQQQADYSKSEALAKDLKNFNTKAPQSFKIDNENLTQPQLIGYMYVIEGSMLGGMLMSKNLPLCTNIPSFDRHYFFTKDPKESLARWKQFKNAVTALTFSDKEIREAITAAKQAFKIFEKAYQSQLKV